MPRPFQFYRYDITWDAAGTLINSNTTTGNWIEQGRINSYHANTATLGKGMPKEYRPGDDLAAWPSEFYEWKNGLITKRTFESLNWVYDYYPLTRLVACMTDVDGRKSAYSYDKLGRLLMATKDNATFNTTNSTIGNGNVKTDYEYHYANPIGTDKNWVRTTTTFAPTTGSSLLSTDTKQYIDGLGRPLQTVKKAWSPTSKDVIVDAVEYDQYGRVTKQFTPFESTGSTGNFLAIPTAQKYTLAAYEPSPLNRSTSVTPPDWYATTTQYGTNIANEVYYKNGSASTAYNAGELTKLTVLQPKESGKNTLSIIYKDKKGRLILSRTQEEVGSIPSATNKADTYYLYDDQDRQTKVLPPSVALTDANLLFEYRYDVSDRLIYKKVPDAAAVNMRYNNRDLLRLVQDGNLAGQFKWLLTDYDNYGRATKTGITAINSNPDPNTAILFETLFSETFYGTTAGINNGKVTQSKTYAPGIVGGIEQNFTYDAVTGRNTSITGNSHLNITASTNNFAFVYDFAGNLMSEERTFTGEPVYKKRMTYDHAGRMNGFFHTLGGNAEKQLSLPQYDFRDRLATKNLGKTANGTYLQKIDYEYNEQNWLTGINTAAVFPTTPTPTALTLTPTIPNPTETAITAGYTPDVNDLFKLQLNYNTGVGTPQYNGNIASLQWQTRGREAQRYQLAYDFLNRLTDATYADINTAGTATTDNKFQETVTYADLRGNISSIVRKGLYKTPSTATAFTVGQIDNLAFLPHTSFNRLKSVAESVANADAKKLGFNPGAATGTAMYAYDANGNMTNDPYKGLGISYNHLNLPTQFTFTPNTNKIDILYDYTGKKLRKTVTTAGAITYIQDYVGNLEWRKQGTDPRRLEALYHDEGRIVPAYSSATATTPSSYAYEYSLRDHLGNTRLTFADANADGIVQVPEEINQENHYYPFGMSMGYSWLNNASQDSKYQYNGKELSEEFGLNLMDYGARWYDAQVPHWLSVDPLSELYFEWSGYNYVMGNPIANIDPDGRSVTGDYYSESGKHLGSDGVNDDKVYSVKEGTYASSADGSRTVVLEQGVTELQNSDGTSFSHKEFRALAGAIYSEGSTTSNEAAAIYGVLKNRATSDNSTVSEEIRRKNQVYGWSHRGQIDDPRVNQDRLKNAFSGVIKGLTESKDYSNGGYYWHGTDFKKPTNGSKAHELFYLSGFKFADASHNLYGLGDLLVRNTYKYESTAAYGKTTFMKLYDNTLKWDGSGKK
jgi:RHS repeat-associated protein